MAVFLLASAWLTLVQTGHFRLFGGTGVYVISPLLTRQLFYPDNGPASAELDPAMRGCMPEIDYQAVPDDDIARYLGTIWVCLDASGWEEERIFDLFSRAYVEAIERRPVLFMMKTLEQNGSMLAFPVGKISLSEGYVGPTFPQTCQKYAWCDDSLRVAQRGERFQPALVQAFRLITYLTVHTTQPHLTAVAYLPGIGVTLPLALEHPLAAWRAAPLPILLAWLLVLGITIAMTRGQARLMVLACIVLIHYSMFSVVIGNVFIPRYAQPLSPFYVIISATFAVMVARWVMSRLPGRSGLPLSPAAEPNAGPSFEAEGAPVRH